MFKHFVGVELQEEETALIEVWLVQNFVSSELTLDNLRKLFMTEFRHQSLGRGDKKLALETIDITKDPYFMRNHLGTFECRLCLTLHSNEGSYLAHT